MEIHPHDVGSARLWHHEEQGLICLSVWTERIRDHGEDADPLVLLYRPSGRGLLAVFDGVGGAGRASAGRTPDGAAHTQAWVASRRLRGLVEEWFVSDRPHDELGPHIAARLATDAKVHSRMRGTIRREFPSTLAALDFRPLPDGRVSWDVLWAGDSRCYVAQPHLGLQQLSRDDTEGSDALALLVQDPPMTNMVCANREFALNRWQGRAPQPCVLIAATDGFFGYVATPAQFEHVLWDTLEQSSDAKQWADLLARRVSAYTGDDASLAVVALGFASFAQLCAAFHDRGHHLRAAHDEPVSRAGDQQELTTAREDSWRRYQPGYERQWPRLVPAGAEEVR
jgi:serine/threonine protein phosphatase PrpC